MISFLIIIHTMRSYEQFWKELLPAYPITKGEITLPISTSLEDFDIDHKEIVIELDNITQQLFKQNDKAKLLASDGYGQ